MLNIFEDLRISSAHLDMRGTTHEEDAFAIDSSVTAVKAFRAQFQGRLRYIDR